MNEEQLEQATAGAVEQRDISCRQVSNGFVLSGIRRFVEPTTGALRLQQNIEGVATDTVSACVAIDAFLQSGKL